MTTYASQMIKRHKARKKLKGTKEEVFAKARRCYETQMFQEYLEALIEYEQSVIECIKLHPVNDPGYALSIVKYKTELTTIERLKVDVEISAALKDGVPLTDMNKAVGE